MTIVKGKLATYNKDKSQKAERGLLTMFKSSHFMYFACSHDSRCRCAWTHTKHVATNKHESYPVTCSGGKSVQHVSIHCTGTKSLCAQGSSLNRAEEAKLRPIPAMCTCNLCGEMKACMCENPARGDRTQRQHCDSM